MKRLSLTISVMGCLLLAGVGTACGQEPLTCAIRAGVGAFILYVVLRLAGTLAVRILADAVFRNTQQALRRKDPS
jgi:hypothetical protein